MTANAKSKEHDNMMERLQARDVMGAHVQLSQGPDDQPKSQQALVNVASLNTVDHYHEQIQRSTILGFRVTSTIAGLNTIGNHHEQIHRSNVRV
jgi:hypothetical protein